MCGITGIYQPGGLEEAAALPITAMTDSLEHRGPDDSDTWLDRDGGIALGHRRLSILDLSPLGRQPMHSACGRYVLAYNGEVYNHLHLREELELLGHSFRGRSDTETILAAVAQWGMQKALKRFVGMFAMALWDREERSLTLVRDRLGIKPLYYGRVGDGWVFGSELKAMRKHPAFRPGVDRNALALFFRHNYIPAPHTIFDDCWKVEPGQVVTIAGDDVARSLWWDVSEVWKRGEADPFSGSEQGAVEELERRLAEAVSLRMISDVPLGAFLSGGVDSSTVTALMQRQSRDRIRTFSIGFDEQGYNEAEHASAVAEYLGTDHTELYMSARDMLETVADLPAYWDEPFADSSQIPTLILSRLTRHHVTVCLSGDGGDELFSGYDRYFWSQRVWEKLRKIPHPMRSAAAAAAKLIPTSVLSRMGSLGMKACWRLDVLRKHDLPQVYRYFISHTDAPAGFVLGASEPSTALQELPVSKDGWRWMSEVDLKTYLPDDILVKVDRASMAASLEARVPILDHRVVEFAASLPNSMKIRDGKGKWLLKELMYRHVPRELVDRPKMGFGVPVQQWLGRELKPWCDDLLSPETIRRQGFLDAGEVSRMWRNYQAGQTFYCHRLWDVLMFQAWVERGGLT